MSEPTEYFEIVSGPHHIRRPMSDLAALEADLAEIEARQKPAVDVGALAFAAQAGDVEARAKLRALATVSVATDDVTALAWAAQAGDAKARERLRALSGWPK